MYWWVQVPKKVLLQLLGETRVRRFVLEEIIRSSLQSYVKKVCANCLQKETSVVTNNCRCNNGYERRKTLR